MRNDRNFFGFAAADLEEGNDAEHSGDTQADDTGDRNDNSPEKENKSQQNQRIADQQLQRLTQMECDIFGCILAQQSDQNTDHRKQINQFMGTKVFLQTWVKVKENWRDSDFMVRNFGYE